MLIQELFSYKLKLEQLFAYDDEIENNPFYRKSIAINEVINIRISGGNIELVLEADDITPHYIKLVYPKTKYIHSAEIILFTRIYITLVGSILKEIRL